MKGWSIKYITPFSKKEEKGVFLSQVQLLIILNGYDRFRRNNRTLKDLIKRIFNHYNAVEL